MKKKLSFIFATVFALSGFAACKKDDPTVTQTRSGWLLSAPAYMDGTLSFNAYQTGMGLDLDPQNTVGEMQVITQTSREGFDTYLTKVTKNGYTEIVRNEVNGNLSVEYEKDGNILYAYYTNAFKEARVIEDSASVTERAFEYDYTQQDNESTTIYQYALMNDPYGNNNSSTPYADNGMFYILHQANNKLILVDGGSAKQVTDDAEGKSGTVSGLLDFLYEITGKQAGEKIDISAFILTHAHGDHKQFVHKLVRDYSDKINIERAMYNVPYHANQTSFVPFGKLLKETYPNIQYLKPHTGQSIRLGEITLDIMLTHEDLVDGATAISKISNFNNTSTVIKYTVNGKTFMQLADLSADEDGVEKILLGMYQSGANEYAALKSDIVQVAHHALQTGMEKTYKAIGASYAFVPQADCSFEKYKLEQRRCDIYQSTVNDVIAANASVKFFFQSRHTYGLRIAKNGTISETAPIAIQNANADYAALLDDVNAFGEE